tara:strand:- start:539 stop:1825 length:1287 start_codon:yes stop_codon:yes gene_type:complete
MPAPTQIKSYPTPLIDDVLFYELLDFSQKKYADTSYGDQHYDHGRWPDHKVVSIEVVKKLGENICAVHYAADRKKQDLYNFEHSLADLGGVRYETITRTYVVRRDEYNSVEPKLGTVMPNLPAGKFANYSDFVIISRKQERISERGRKAQESIGGAELNSLYVVESRTYVNRTELVTSEFSDKVNGVLYQRTNIYLRGESYNHRLELQDWQEGYGEEVSIEDAVNREVYWEPTWPGQISSYNQVSTDVWVVTTRDIISQDSVTTGSKYGGRVIRTQKTVVNHAWPAVLDGVRWLRWPLREAEGDKGREYPQVIFEKQGYRGLCQAEIHDEWVRGVSGASFEIETLETAPVNYSCPFFSLNIPPCLHGDIYIHANIGNKDPKWKWNLSTEMKYKATPFTNWPTSLVIDINPSPHEGGYIVRTVTCFPPY